MNEYNVHNFLWFKKVFLHAQCTSTLFFWLPKSLCFINIITYSWCCSWTFVWWRFKEMNNKCWNNINKLFSSQKLIFTLRSANNVQINQLKWVSSVKKTEYCQVKYFFLLYWWMLICNPMIHLTMNFITEETER